MNQRTKAPKNEIDGILVLNKGLGMSSNKALQRVKHHFQARKAGHTGSLDPLATGVLPLCFGRATKLAQKFLDADKAYRVVARLGVKTTTGDMEGEVITDVPVPNYSLEVIEAILAKFRGAISQVPSMYSALKHNGQPLYKLARQNITVDRPARDIYIHKLELIKQTANSLELVVVCSKGTYIRSLVEDIGSALGCGAHVAVLKRTQAGPFMLENSWSLEQVLACDNIAEFKKNFLLPLSQDFATC